MQYIPKSHVLAQILYSDLEHPVISLTATLNTRCFNIDCYFHDFETSAKGPYISLKVSGHSDHAL